MTTSIDPALLARLSGEFTTLGTQLGVLGSDLRLLREQVVADISVRPAAPGTWGAGVPGETHPTSDRPGVPGTEAVRGAESHAKGAGASGVMRESAFDTPAAGVPGDGGGSVSGVSGGVGAPGVARGLAFRTLGAGVPGDVHGSVSDPSGAGVPEAGHGSLPVSTGVGEPGDVRGVVSDPSGAGVSGAARGAVADATGASGTEAPRGSASGEARGSISQPPVRPGTGSQALGAAPESVRPVAGTVSGGTDASTSGFGESGGVPSGAVPPVTPSWPGRSAAGVPVPPPQPAYVPRYAPPPGGGWGGAAWPPNTWGPMPGAVPPRPPVPPRPASPVPHTPWWQRDGVISRILALAGVAVTLIGVAMLLVLAAQAGFFGPVPRVVAGAVFSAGLVATGVRVFGRTGGRVGGIALAATGVAGAYLDVVAVTAIYHWLHPVFGLAVALGVAAGGVGLAMQWRSQPFAVLVVLAAAALSPVVTTRPVLLAFLIVLQLACVPVQLARDWPYLHVARTLPAVLATSAFVAGVVLGTPSAGERTWVLMAAVAVALVGIIGTIVVVRQRPADITASLTMAAALVPILLAPGMYSERLVAVSVASLAAAVLLLVAAASAVPKVFGIVAIPGHTTLVAAVAGSIALLEACVGATDTQTLPTALLLVALVFLGVAGQRMSRLAAGLGGAFAVLGGLALLNVASPETLASQHLSESGLGMSTTLSAVLALAVVAVALWCARRLPGPAAGSAWPWIVASVAGLYAVTTTTVSVGVATGTPNGFVIGHSAATILWMAAATGALLFGLRELADAPAVAKLALGSGLLVTAAALAKLFLFDLATLDGLLRVAAFLVVGILLLLAGTRYARAFADAGADSESHSPATAAAKQPEGPDDVGRAS
ncbi:DUF2339 domain-containing protein [Nocardia beijingensis]|uniref:DUF2339 domain-containing protein n=1 Tax=Nocardia beijingensis TaxID=95162 RepID=UPI001E33B34E|nr:DUF2339 domain-containing protein [Nocardia beijingensis]